MVMCISKVTDLPIYSYKNKLGGWNVVKHKDIRLPDKDGKIDFAFMENFISAIKKLTIKKWLSTAMQRLLLQNKWYKKKENFNARTSNGSTSSCRNHYNKA